MKTCTGCKRELSVSHFGNAKGGKDGLRSKCRDCIREQFREWQEKNRERRNDLRRQAIRANPEPNRERVKEWRKANPERSREAHIRSKAKRREREIAAGMGKKRVSWVKAWEAQNGICGECGEPIDGELKFPDLMRKSHDHIVPLARGGLHVQENVQWTHLYCNMLKSVKV